ncbi:MAG: potassium channel family protein [Fidelibacterota bacterium]
MKHIKRIQIIIWIVTLVVFATIGFYIIGGEEWSLLDSLFMTLITLATVGFQEVHPLSESGQIWTIIIIVFGVTSFAFLISQLGSELLELNQFRRRKMLKHVNKLKSHYIICGYGRMGAVIAREIHEKNQTFVVIENNPAKIRNIQECGYLYVDGDATLEETLNNAGVKKAKGIVVVLNTDQDNLFVSMSIRSLNNNAFLVSKCSADDTSIKLRRIGVDKIVNPYIAGGHKMSELLLTPQLEDSVSITTPQQTSIDYGIDEIKISDFSTYDGMMIKDSQLRENYGLLIVGIIEENGDVKVNPGSDHVLNKDQTIMVIGRKENLKNFTSSI